MANAVIIKTRCQCENIDALNRKAKNTSADLPNGTPVTLAWSAVEGDEVFTATVATSGLAFNIGRKEAITIASQNFLVGEQVDAWYLEVTTGGWMIHSPEVNKDVVGEVLKGADPRNFTNAKGIPFDVIKLEVGDIIQVSKDFFYTANDPDTITGANIVVLTSDGFKAQVSA